MTGSNSGRGSGRGRGSGSGRGSGRGRGRDSGRGRGRGHAIPTNLVFCHECACYCTHNESECRINKANTEVKAYYNCHNCHKSVSAELVEGTIFVPSIPCTTCNHPMAYADNTY